MRKRKFTSEIAFRISDAQKEAITRIADTEEKGLGEAARELLDIGIKAKAGA